MTPAQCRAARALIEWTQPKLADAGGVGLSTVVDFERSRRAVSVESATAIRAALEAAGVIFIDANGHGPGVRLRKIVEAERRPSAEPDQDGARVIAEVLAMIAGTKLDTVAYRDKIKQFTPNDQVTAAKRDLAIERNRQRAGKSGLKR